jgi:hypothetical protein
MRRETWRCHPSLAWKGRQRAHMIKDSRTQRRREVTNRPKEEVWVDHKPALATDEWCGGVGGGGGAGEPMPGPRHHGATTAVQDPPDNGPTPPYAMNPRQAGGTHGPSLLDQLVAPAASLKSSNAASSLGSTAATQPTTASSPSNPSMSRKRSISIFQCHQVRILRARGQRVVAVGSSWADPVHGMGAYWAWIWGWGTGWVVAPGLGDVGSRPRLP